MIIDLIAGARPNFMKIAPIIDAIKKKQDSGVSIHYRLIHTGQHYDKNMSATFFEQLSIPTPDMNLGAGGGSQAEQTAAIMIGYEEVLNSRKPDLCVVVGDVNSTMACAITAKKMHVPVAHVEAGIRSGDITMPEEINRMVTDSITDLFFTTSRLAGENLIKCGITPDQIFFVGNTMIDTLLKQRPRFKKPPVWSHSNLSEKNYLVMTLHRPGNVDEENALKSLMKAIIKSTRDLPLIFPVHPRTAKKIAHLGFDHPRVHQVPPLPYLEFNYLVEHSKAVITDSGGITEEATVMGIPCMTLRDSTERPETVTIGTNMLLGTNPDAIQPAMDRLFENRWQNGSIPEKWDGKAAERIVDILCDVL